MTAIGRRGWSTPIARGGRAPEYLEIEMKDAIVSSYQLGDQEEVPSDMVSDQPDDAGTP